MTLEPVYLDRHAGTTARAVGRYMTLEPGDLVLTGTPAGVGPVAAGDTIEASLSDQAGTQLASLRCGVQASS